jgi:hypothetical protein
LQFFVSSALELHFPWLKSIRRHGHVRDWCASNRMAAAVIPGMTGTQLKLALSGERADQEFPEGLPRLTAIDAHSGPARGPDAAGRIRHDFKEWIAPIRRQHDGCLEPKTQPPPVPEKVAGMRVDDSALATPPRFRFPGDLLWYHQVDPNACANIELKVARQVDATCRGIGGQQSVFD